MKNQTVSRQILSSKYYVNSEHFHQSNHAMPGVKKAGLNGGCAAKALIFGASAGGRALS